MRTIAELHDQRAVEIEFWLLQSRRNVDAKRPQPRRPN